MTCETLLTASNEMLSEQWVVEAYTELIIGALRGEPFMGETRELTPEERDAMVESIENLIDGDGMFCGFVEANPEDWE